MMLRLVPGLAIALAACTPAASAKEGPTMSSDGSAVAGSAHAAHAAQGLALSASAKGTQLHLVLTNQGASDVQVLSHVNAGSRVDLDWYTVTITAGGAARELRFVGDRDHAGRVRATLAPGASVAHDVDLAWWAGQPVNGGKPLPTGAVTLVATYTVDGEPGVWNGRVEAPAVSVRW
jgi:hypothetical protein